MNRFKRCLFFLIVFGLVPVVFLGCWEAKRVAVLFVGHGEPSAFEDGDVVTRFWDGSDFGPHGDALGVAPAYQLTEWAAAYEEIATAISYLVPCTDPPPAPFLSPSDSNCNGIPHEAFLPGGDVPEAFDFFAFRGMVEAEYSALGNYSPHNDILAEHVANIHIGALGKYVDKYLAFLDAEPRIPDVLHEIAQKRRYKRIVLVPLLLADSTHTQEVAEITHEWAAKERPMEILITESFVEIPYMREKLAHAVAGMARHIHSSIPAEVPDGKIGVILAAHGTPYVPPYPEFGWQEGDIFSKLTLTEGDFHDDIAKAIPWKIRTGRMSYGSPTIEESLAAFETDGKTHVIVVPSAFPTAAIHTMWDIANPSVGRPLTPAEGIVQFVREPDPADPDSCAAEPCATVYYSAQGYADVQPGKDDLRDGLRFVAEMGLLELFESNRDQFEFLD